MRCPVPTRAAQAAEDRGVGVLLSGDAADELLGVPRFATAAVANQYGLAGAFRYVRDVAGSGPGVLGELAGIASHLLPSRFRARTYWAANWPEWCDPVAPQVLAEPYRSLATDWARLWVRQQIDEHAEAGRTWAEADAHDSFYPHDPIPAAGQVPTESPFLAPAFISAALALPLARRFDPALPTAYQRCKAQVVELFPAHLQTALPRVKQYFTTALTHLMPADREAPLATAAGLFDQAALAAEDDPSVLLMTAATERWLVRALELAQPAP
jgi:asparagine synthase (glutamine-hydrolysing)